MSEHMGACQKCQCMLFQVITDAGNATGVECNMCGERRMFNRNKTLTLNDADLLAGLIRGVQAGAKLRWYPYGADDSDATMHMAEFSLRAFTLCGGGFIRDDEDVRDAYVWCSGIFERWLKVSDLITALDNMDGKHGLDKPMAIIDYDKEPS